VNLDAIAEFPLRSILKAHGEADEAIENAERKRDAFIAAVKTADNMEPSRSKWELYAVQDAFTTFMNALPADLAQKAGENIEPIPRG